MEDPDRQRERQKTVRKAAEEDKTCTPSCSTGPGAIRRAANARRWSGRVNRRALIAALLLLLFWVSHLEPHSLFLAFFSSSPVSLPSLLLFAPRSSFFLFSPLVRFTLVFSFFSFLFLQFCPSFATLQKLLPPPLQRTDLKLQPRRKILVIREGKNKQIKHIQRKSKVYRSNRRIRIPQRARKTRLPP